MSHPTSSFDDQPDRSPSWYRVYDLPFRSAPPLAWDWSSFTPLLSDEPGPSSLAYPPSEPTGPSPQAAATSGLPLTTEPGAYTDWTQSQAYIDSLVGSPPSRPGAQWEEALASSSSTRPGVPDVPLLLDSSPTADLPEWFFPAPPRLPPPLNIPSRSNTQSSSTSSTFDPLSHPGDSTPYTPSFPSSSSSLIGLVELPAAPDAGPDSPLSTGSQPSPEVGTANGLDEDEIRRRKKERRKATNRASARAFRDRQKASLDLHVALLEERDAEVARLRSEVARLSDENLSLNLLGRPHEDLS